MFFVSPWPGGQDGPCESNVQDFDDHYTFWQITEIADFSYTTTVLSGKLDVGDVGMRVLGVVWLLIAVAFVIAGVAIFFSPPWWWSYTLAVTIASLIVTLLGWPDAKFGVLANIIILLFLFFGPRLGWIAR